MAKKSSTKKQNYLFFDVYIYLEGGSEMMLEDTAQTREELVEKLQTLLVGPETWLRLSTLSGKTHLRGEKVIGFHVEETCRDDFSGSAEVLDEDDIPF